MALFQEGSTIADSLVDEDQETPDMYHERMAMQRDLESVMSTLTEKERTIVAMRYGIGSGLSHTLEEVGVALGVTRERIRQIEQKALMRLRKRAASFLSSYVEEPTPQTPNKKGLNRFR